MSVVVGALSRHLFQKKVDYPRTFLHLLHKMIKYGTFWRPHRESKTNIVSCGLEVNKTVGDVGHGSAHERAHTTRKINDYGKPIHLMILFLSVIKLY